MLAAFERFMNEGTYTNNSLHTFILHTKPFIFDGNGALSTYKWKQPINCCYVWNWCRETLGNGSD